MSAKQDIFNITPIPIERVAFGVRFQPRYEMLDHFGIIVDQILRSKGSPFNSTMFPLSTREPGVHTLLNPETGDELRLTESDVVLETQIDSRKTSEVKTLAEHFMAYVLGTIRDVTHLRDIVRYGLLFRLAECSSSLQKTPVEYFVQNDFKDARSLSLRFTRRLPVLESMVKKGVNDYRSVIYTVKQTDDSKVNIWIDYQEYFMPELSAKEVDEKPFTVFADRGIEYFLGEFQGWLNKLIGKHEAA